MVQQEAAELRTRLAQREGELEGLREAMRRADAERDAARAEAVTLRGDMQTERAARAAFQKLYGRPRPLPRTLAGGRGLRRNGPPLLTNAPLSSTLANSEKSSASSTA
jgi:hypothetical protein